MVRVPGARTVQLVGGVRAAWSDSSRGDLRPTGHGPGEGRPLAELVGELAAVSGSPVRRVVWASQVHGASVLDVDGVGTDGVATQDGRAGYAVEAWNAGKGDALVARTHDVAVGVLTADCGPLALASPEGVFAAVHAGWRGLRSGVVEAAATRMRELGATGIVGSLGPCIHAGCYAFAEPDLATVAAVYGDRVRGVTGEGGPALDLPAAVTAALEHAGVRAVGGVERCTACGGDSFSHRARRDSGRQALVVWSGAAEGR